MMNRRLILTRCEFFLGVLLALGPGGKAAGGDNAPSAATARTGALKDFYAKLNQQFKQVTLEIDDRRYSRLELRYKLSLATNGSAPDAIQAEPEFVFEASFAKYRLVAYGWEYLDTLRPEPLRFKLSDLQELTLRESGSLEFRFNHPVSMFELNPSEFKLQSQTSPTLTLWLPHASAETQARLKTLQDFLTNAIRESRKWTSKT